MVLIEIQETFYGGPRAEAFTQAEICLNIRYFYWKNFKIAQLWELCPQTPLLIQMGIYLQSS